MKLQFTAEKLDPIFKAYDIRGVYPSEIDTDIAYGVGRAFVQVMNVSQVAVGRDARTSSPEMFEALTKGIMDQGADVVDLGMIGSDMLYFACGKYQYESGLMITASHNPGEYNGIKGCLKNAVPIPYEGGMEEVKNVMLSGDVTNSESKGNIETVDIHNDWIEHILSFVDKENISEMKLVADAGNGMAGPTVTKLFEKIPQVELTEMYFEPDGTFPNHPADPSKEENLVDLKGTMEQLGADIGMAFDGDADRVFFVDDEYEMITGTVMTAMVAKMLLEKHPGETVLYNALCGNVVPETIEATGGKAVRVRVGHSYIKQDMAKYGSIFAGESSGHYFFRDNWNADSGIIAGIIMLEYISSTGKKLSELRKEYEKYIHSGEINTKVGDRDAVLARVKEHYKDLKQDELDGVTVYGDRWWLNVRPSNTEPLIRLNVEGKDQEQVSKIVEEAKGLIY